MMKNNDIEINYAPLIRNDKQMRVIIIHPFIFIRNGLRRLLTDLLPESEIICYHGFTAMSDKYMDFLSADLIVSDITDYHETTSQGMDRLLLLQKMRKNKPIIVITGQQEPALLSCLAKCYSVSLVAATQTQKDIGERIKDVLGGAQVISDEIEIALSQPSHTVTKRIFLTDSEHQVLLFLQKGHTVTVIAQKLSRSVKTISAHKRRIMRKFEVNSEVELFSRNISKYSYL